MNFFIRHKIKTRVAATKRN